MPTRNENAAIKAASSYLSYSSKPSEKKIKLFRASLDNPENTIKNFNTLPKQYQEAFKNNFVDRGYSYQVPKDIKTIYQIGEELRAPKIASEVSKKAAKGFSFQSLTQKSQPPKAASTERR